MECTKKLVFDFEKFVYIASARLLVILDAIQEMEEKGEMAVRNVGPKMMDVFQETGFTDDFVMG